MSARFGSLVLTACVGLAPVAAHAQGHMLHGVGPVNGAMGGAGTALLQDPLGALTFNPALIAGVVGNQLSFGTEFFKDSPRIGTQISFAGAAPSQVSVDGTSEVTILPAFGWISRHPAKKLAIGFGLIGLGGFRTDYPQDNGSFVLAQQPEGYGRVFSDYHVTKIPVAMAYQVTPKLSLGASVNVYYAEYAQGPIPSAGFDLGVNGLYYPNAGNLAGSFGLAGQFGFAYQATPRLTVGGSITTPQQFQKFTWNATVVDPGSVAYGRTRTLTAEMNGPMIASLGTGFTLGKKTRLALDGMFTKFDGVDSLGSPGGIVDGKTNPFGWRNTWTVKAGIEHQLTEKVILRLGYNFSQTPVRSDVVLTAGVFSPATFENHFCGGFGYKLFPFLTAEASFYYVPREHVSGPFGTVQGFDLGTLDVSNQVSSAVAGFRFTF